MATRSAIGIRNTDGSVSAVYCHWDGYPQHNGVILQRFYNEEKTRQLIAEGDLSSLGRDIGTKHSFEAKPDYIEVGGTHVAPECTFYARDRGEDPADRDQFVTPSHYVLAMEHSGCEYFYLLDNGVWHVNDGRGWEPLESVLNEVNE